MGQDIPWLLVQLREFDKFFGAAHSLVPEEDKAIERLAYYMNPEVGCFFIAGRHEPGESAPGNRTGYTVEVERLGFIAGFLSHEHPFGAPIRSLNEIFWWVVPEHRGSRAGSLLLDAYDTYAAQHVDWGGLTLEAKSPVNPAALERRGFRLYESNYLKEYTTPCASTITAAPAGCS